MPAFTMNSCRFCRSSQGWCDGFLQVQDVLLVVRKRSSDISMSFVIHGVLVCRLPTPAALQNNTPIIMRTRERRRRFCGRPVEEQKENLSS